MPWIIGNGTALKVLEPPAPFALTSLWEEPLGLAGPASYCGYLLEGFRADLDGGRFLPGRLALAQRAGWQAVAPSVRTEDPELASLLGPFLAPTAPRPHARAPLGLTLFLLEGLESRWGGALAERRESLSWASRLASAPGCPVFCDPILELRLDGRTAAETAACSYQPRPGWRSSWAAVTALLSGVSP